MNSNIATTAWVLYHFSTAEFVVLLWFNDWFHCLMVWHDHLNIKAYNLFVTSVQVDFLPLPFRFKPTHSIHWKMPPLVKTCRLSFRVKSEAVPTIMRLCARRRSEMLSSPSSPLPSPPLSLHSSLFFLFPLISSSFLSSLLSCDFVYQYYCISITASALLYQYKCISINASVLLHQY